MVKKSVVIAAIIITIIAIGAFINIDFDAIALWIQDLGPAGPMIFIIIMAIAVVISPIPSLPLDIMAGATWGWFLGGTYAIIGAEIGAIIAFLIARKYGRKIMKRFAKDSIALCDNTYSGSLPWFIFGTRLLPIFQFDIISYAAGLTNIKLRTFAIATLFGMAPITYFIAYGGKSFMIGTWPVIIITIIIIAAMIWLPRLLKR